jgi:hypothetical protein
LTKAPAFGPAACHCGGVSVIASEAKQSSARRAPDMDCFGLRPRNDESPPPFVPPPVIASGAKQSSAWTAPDMDCFGLRPRNDGGPRLLSRRLSLRRSLRQCERSEAIHCVDCPIWIASGCALAMTKAVAFCPAACHCGGVSVIASEAKQSSAWSALSGLLRAAPPP